MPNHSERALSGRNHHETFATPEHADDPFVLLSSKNEREHYEGTFAIDLTGVLTNSKENGIQDSRPEEHATTRLVASVFSGLSSGEGIEFVYRCGKSAPFVWRIYGHVTGDSPEETLPRAKDLYTSLCNGIRASNQAYRFSPVSKSEDFLAFNEHYPWQRQMVTEGVAFRKANRNPIGFVCGAATPGISGEVRIPDLSGYRGESFNHLASALTQCRVPVDVRLALVKIVLSSDEAAMIADALEWLQNCEAKEVVHDGIATSGAQRRAHLESACNYLENWIQHRWGTRLTITVASDEPVPSSLLGMLAQDLAHGKNASLELIADGAHIRGLSKTAGVDLQCCFPAGSLLPPFFPVPAQLERAHVRREYNHSVPRLRGEGVVLGYVNGGARRALVRFSEADRSRHTYILGSTGTGKSSLLANMIVQDIHKGHGVCVLDPHGDMYSQVLARIPRERVCDLILVNPCDQKRSVGINFLESGGPHCRTEIHFLVNEMMSIFQSLYLREMQGPMFETYMRNAMLLVMENEAPGATLLDIPLVFENVHARNLLLAKCRNPMVRDFWQKTAEKVRGDCSISNIAPYITSKLNMFVYNPVMRSIIGQAKSTINFREAMDKGQIILVNLSKGLLGELDTRLLGMLITGKLFCAALNRIATPAAKRRPHFLYVDEFQNFTSGTISHMMSEARKFGLYLTLANQNLGQLTGNQDVSSLSEAVLCNAGTLLCFRTGAPDAERIKVHTMPEFSSQDIQYLPDFHVIAKLLVNNSPTRPFVFETLPLDVTPTARGLKRSIENARKRYTVETREVEKAIAYRRAEIGKN